MKVLLLISQLGCYQLVHRSICHINKLFSQDAGSIFLINPLPICHINKLFLNNVAMLYCEMGWLYRI